MNKIPPCHMCPAVCCHYVTLQIDTPETKKDFEQIKWYVAHKDISVYVDEGEWFLEMKSRCTFLGEDFRCQAYERRPSVCRDYGNDDKGEVNCHMSEGELAYEHFFQSMDEVEAYIAEYCDFESASNTIG